MSNEEPNEITLNHRIELFYKNLQHITNSYYSSEGKFPLWESIYALIIGQLIIAYFGQGIVKHEKYFLCFVGLIFSISWLILVHLSNQYSRDRTGKIELLEDHLEEEYKRYWRSLGPSLDFPFYRLTVPEKKDAPFWKKTWSYRKLVPIALFIIWILLIILAYFDP